MDTLSKHAAATREAFRQQTGQFGEQPHADAGLVDMPGDDALNEAQDRIHEGITATVKTAFPYASAVKVSRVVHSPGDYDTSHWSNEPKTTHQLDEVIQYGAAVWHRGERWPVKNARTWDLLNDFDPDRMDEELITGNRMQGYTIALPNDIREEGSVSGSSPEVVDGATAPEVVWSGGRNWYRSDAGATDPYSMRIQANRALTADEAQQLAQLTGYAYRTTICGESLGDPDQDTRASIIVQADFTKSARDDVGVGMMEFEELLPVIVKHGSQVRKTDRAGAGTKDTRLVEGLGDDLQVTIYYDCC